MKLSRFNNFVEHTEEPDCLIAYNSRTNALALIEKGKYDKIPQLLDGSYTDDSFLADLAANGFLVEDDFDEMRYIQYFRNTRYQERVLGLTIAPTMDCNFKCSYCYQGDRVQDKYMSAQTIEDLMNFIDSYSLSGLQVFWYGGEPLLAMDTICALSEKMIAYCDDKSIPYTASIVTNGYYLTDENCLLLKKYKVDDPQITLDGSRSVHNQRRPLREGTEGSYDTILNNLATASKYFSMRLRINVDRANANDYMEVIEDLRQRDLIETVAPYLGIIDDDDPLSETCLSPKEVSDLQLNFNQKMYSLTQLERYLPKSKYPEAIINRCSADIPNSFVVGPQGDLYKCWKHINDPALIIGNVKTGVDINATYINFVEPDDIASSPKCGVCSLYPLCYGGCIDQDVRNHQRKCIPMKYSMGEYLNNVAKQLA